MSQTLILLLGFHLQILWGNLGWCCSQCNPERPKNQLDLQACPQAQGASGTDFCWKEIQGSTRKGTFAPQGTPFKKGNLEEEQHTFSPTLSLMLMLIWWCAFLLYHPCFWVFCISNILSSHFETKSWALDRGFEVVFLHLKLVGLCDEKVTHIYVYWFSPKIFLRILGQIRKHGQMNATTN